MSTIDSDKALSLSHIARAAGIDRFTVRVLIEHYRIPVLRGPSMTAVRPEGRRALIRALERHPGVEPGVADRL